MLFDYEQALTIHRKDATQKTAATNAETYKSIDWEQVKSEQNLADYQALVRVPFPLIFKKNQLQPVWDLRKYAFLFQQSTPATVHPKLWEQGKLNVQAGLYQVTENIFQVRGFDMANITFVKGKTGWIVIDCLTSKETAEEALKLVNQHCGKRPVRAVIFSHSHIDHYGGVLGVLPDSIQNKTSKVYAPAGFMDAVIDENVTAATAMTRRSQYMYGIRLRRDEKGLVDNGIGKEISFGTITLIKGIEEICPSEHHPYVSKRIDGVSFQFQLTPGTEAPAEMNIYIPSEKSLCIAENCTATQHNLYTLRGAKVRDAAAWARYLQQAIDLFGQELTTVFGVHNWPRLGNESCINYIENQRDVYQYIHDQTLRLMNQGYTIDHVGRMMKLPETLSQEWYTNGFYGTVNHNAKAVYQRYMGWYNSNPVDLNKLFPEKSAKKYVEYMGGADNIVKKAQRCFQQGDYQWVAEVTKQVIYADPHHVKAKLLCADALEQLGYIAESGPWRNEYLTGAKELRLGNIPLPANIITKEVWDTLPLKNILELFSIRVDGLKAGACNYRILFVIPDRNEVALTELKHGIFRYLGDTRKNAEVTVTMWQDTLYRLTTTNDHSYSSVIFVQGDKSKWDFFLSSQDSINPNFNIVTPVSKK
ncbi:alkyl sulfatase dimerization domain-containing protein [Priestia megaterium]